MNSWQSGIVPISGGHLAFHRTGGPGPALVLSHGLTDNGLCWSRVAAALAPEFDVVMLDARGHGNSSRMSARESHDPGEDIAEAIEQLGLASPIVMGHSVGARATAMGKASSPGWHEDEFPAWTAAKKQVDPEAMPDYSTSWQDSIAAITAPTLSIYGERDRGSIVTAELAEEAKLINPKISTVRIAGAGHNIRRENFSDFLAAVHAFLITPY